MQQEPYDFSLDVASLAFEKASLISFKIQNTNEVVQRQRINTKNPLSLVYRALC